ncbi:RAD55 family ATPase [Archaeoglobus neptunius]|uniref:RAD55 family ATPase n=1 Tax=Archaeoglobus neptunius TaxID=2798580 RepID=UPI001926FEA8|nr:RAD55 family ATPase [Archaeoglobus neptunius]
MVENHAKFGIQKLDDYLGGGLNRHSENLIIGRSGIGKTILAAHWAAEGARNGETVVYLSTTMNKNVAKNYLKRFPFMEDVYEKIHWRFIRVDPKFLLPLTREKIVEGLKFTFGMDGEDIDRVVFDSCTDLEKTLADPVLYRRAITYMADLSYEYGITSLWVEEAPMKGEWSDTKNITESVIFLDLLRVSEGYTRALRILKKYGSKIPLEWIPYDITENGIEIKDGFLVRREYEYEFKCD